MDKNNIAILADSGYNVREDRGKSIFVVPLYITNGKEAKKDTVKISADELYEKINTEVYKTAAPSVDDFREKISYIKDLGYDKILAISLSSNLSGTYNSMKLALESSNTDYKLLDSKFASLASGLLVSYGTKLIEDGKNLEEIYEILKKKRSYIRIFGLVSDLKYLIRGGRISHVKGLIGSMLKITPILKIGEDGTIDKFKTLRGQDKALKYMTAYVINELKTFESYYLGLSYGKSKDDIRSIKKT